MNFMKMHFSNRKAKFYVKFALYLKKWHNYYVNKFYKEVINMTEIRRQLKEYIKMVGAENLIYHPTPKEKEAFEGILFTRGLPNISIIQELAS